MGQHFIKTNEFIEQTNNLGFSAEIEDEMIVIRHDCWVLATAHIDRSYKFNTDYNQFRKIPKEIRNKLLDLIVAYAKTPVPLRKEISEFILRVGNDEYKLKACNYKVEEVKTDDTSGAANK